MATAITAALAVLGVVLIVLGTSGPDRAAPRTVVAESPTETTASKLGGKDEQPSTPPRPADDVGTRPDFGPVLPGSPPVGLDIPRIGVHSTDIVDLAFQQDGSIEVPKDHSSPGWFSPGPSPGQFGPAVIAGHVDSKTGPAVFYRLAELRPGHRVKVTRQDGSVATFVIDRVETFTKRAFPTREVYGATDRAELRLITCSGDYDAQEGYLSNTIAFAHLV